MDEALRGELNRLWTNQHAAEMVLAHLVADKFDRTGLSALHENLVMTVEQRHKDDPETAASMARALDHLFHRLDGAVEGRKRPR